MQRLVDRRIQEAREMPRASKKTVPVEDQPPEEPKPAYPLFAVCAVKRVSESDRAAPMYIQKALFGAWAELYGGRMFEGETTQLLLVSCPDGDPAVAKEAILSRCDIYSTSSAREAEHLQEVIIAKAREADMAGMGLSALISVLNRMAARYDVMVLEE